MGRLVQILLAGLLLAAPGVVRAQGGEERPLFLVHYMPWFQARSYTGYWGWHWTMGHFNPDLPDAQGRRPIASHVYPLAGPYDSRDPDLVEYHALLMKVGGIDGAIVDWYGASTLYDYPLINGGADAVFGALADVGLRFAICYEDRTVPQLIAAGRITASGAVAHARQEMAYVRDRWASTPTYLTLDGRPVVLNFGAQYFRTSAEWASILSVFETSPLFFTEDVRLAPAAAGAYPWPPMWASQNGVLTVARMRQYLDEFYGRAAAWPDAVAGAWPGFHDIYAEAGVGPSYGYLDARGGATFEETLGRAVGSGARVVQIATWNDFGEGTAIEPTVEDGYRYLEHVQETVRGYGPLPYSADDLGLPLTLYGLRKAHAGDPEVSAQLDEAAVLLADGQPAQARARLAAISSTGAAPGATPALRAGLSVYPNPTAGPATVRVDLPDAAHVRLDVYDATGRRVARLAHGAREAGRHTFRWDAAGGPSGAYFVRLDVGEESTTAPLTVQR
jgi:hypothetical protein